MNNDKPMGVFYDMPFAQYQAVQAMSQSALRELARSPWHLKNRIDKAATRPMLHGTLVHCAQLEPHALAERYVVVPEDAPRKPSKTQLGAKKPSPETVETIKWWSEFARANSTRQIVSLDDYNTLGLQLEALHTEPEIDRLFSKGRGEVSVFWRDRLTGVYCKARIDWVHTLPDGRLVLLDLKSVSDDQPHAFSRSVASMGYHRQQAHYTAGATEAMGAEVADFVFPVVSSTPPILAVPYRLDDDTRQQGFDEVNELLQIYRDCVKADDWPPYSPAERLIGLPAYARRMNELEVAYADA